MTIRDWIFAAIAVIVLSLIFGRADPAQGHDECTTDSECYALCERQHPVDSQLPADHPDHVDCEGYMWSSSW